MNIDRMELADIGNPIELAKAIIKQLPDLTIPVPIKEIAHAVGIKDIQPITTSGFEGGLIAQDDKSSGFILFNQASTPQRQRFTIGHELGHFLNSWHRPDENGQIMCSSANMIVASYNKNDKRQKMEVEANQFSAELLMPSTLLKADIRRLKAPEIDHIVTLANKYDVSKEAMGRRYIEFHDESCAIVFSKNGKILYVHKHQYFPSLGVWNNDAIPSGAITKSFKGDEGSSSEWQEHSGETWLSNGQGKKIYEQVLVQKNGYRVTLLTRDEEADEDNDEEENLKSKWRPRF
jgi:Zn-dependent peptidase ImmA (M78 family)